MVLAGPELPELFKEGPRKGYCGYIANIVGYQNRIMVENVIADTKDEMRAFDIFNAQGQIQKRIVTHPAMIGSPMAEHVYFLDTNKTYRLKDLQELVGIRRV